MIKMKICLLFYVLVFVFALIFGKLFLKYARADL
jgi:hypothetical protein